MDADFHAPHLIDLEVPQVLKRLVATGALSLQRALDARDDYAEFSLVRYPHHPFLDRIWELREDLSAYDAAFVALAEVLDAALVTADARLAGAPGHTARIEAFGA